VRIVFAYLGWPSVINLEKRKVQRAIGGPVFTYRTEGSLTSIPINAEGPLGRVILFWNRVSQVAQAIYASMPINQHPVKRTEGLTPYPASFTTW